MNIDELTVGELREIAGLAHGLTGESKSTGHPYTIGSKVLIRTVTHYYTGRIMAVYPQEIVLETAAWIANTGRYHDALKTGELSEVEPIIGQAIIGRGAIVDCVPWDHDLPEDQK